MPVCYEAPESIKAVAQLLKPVEQSLNDSLWQSAAAPTLPPLSRCEVRQHFQGIRRFAAQVVSWLNRDLVPLTRVERPDMQRVQKAIDQISLLVDAQLAKYQTLLSSHDASGDELNALLCDAYRHNLFELQHWMASLID